MRIQTYRPRRSKKGMWNSFKRLPLKQKFLRFFGVFFVLLGLYSWLGLPSVDEAAQLVFSESTIIYDRGALDPKNDPNDHILYVIHGDENREFVPLEEISPHVINATLSIEDDNFYSWWHWGFDIGGILKAVLAELGIGPRRGGSTITQQLVKNTFLSRERTYLRKFNEILLSIKMELKYSKDEILEMYLNKIPYGHNAHGIEAAAKTFFGKSARDLTIAEASILASLPVAPTRFSPYGANKRLLMGWDECNGEIISGKNEEEQAGASDPEVSQEGCEYKKGRKDLVLQRMLDTEKITFEQFKTAWSESKNLEFNQNKTDIKAPHFVFYVRQLLEEKYGKEFLREGGLRIYTTLDRDLQDIAEETIAVKSIAYSREWNANNAALTAIDPENGQILAYVGGKDYFDEKNDGQVDVLTSRRQPGSSFKPLVYATAFEKGYAPSTLVFDVETDFGGNYRPQNFDGAFSGPVTIREALNRSLNIPAVKMAHLGKPASIFANAQKLGIKIEGTPEDHGVALGIGVAEVEPLSHINSLQTFVGDGSYFQPSAILQIQNSSGKILEKFDPSRTKKEGLDAQVVALVRDILTDEKTRPTTDGFDWNNLLQLKDLDNGSKTGTSNRRVKNPDFNEEFPEDPEKNPRMITAPGDSWTVGFTPHLVGGVWIGNNDGAPMTPGATGLTVAAPIWKKFMNDAHSVLAEKFIQKNPEKLLSDFWEKKYPDAGLERKKINKYTGKIATEKTSPALAADELFTAFSAPIDLDDFSEKDTKAKKSVFVSLQPNVPNWQNPVDEWLKENPDFFQKLGIQKEYLRGYFTDRDYESFWSQYLQKYGAQGGASGNNSAVQEAKGTRILSPQNNQRIPINATFEAFLDVEKPEEIEKIQLFINQNLVGQRKSAPFYFLVSTKGQKPRKTDLTAQIWKTDGTVEEKTVPLVLEREKILQNQEPLLGSVKHTPQIAQVQVLSGAKRDLQEIRLLVSQRGETLYDRRISQPSSFIQFSVPKNARGFVNLEVFATFAGEAEKKTSQKQVRF